MTPEQREELKVAASAATPGPWRQGGRSITMAPHQVIAGEGSDLMVLMSGNQNFFPQAKLDAAYIAAANPAAILSLIAQVEALNRKNLELQRVYDERGLQIDRLEVALQRSRVEALTVPQGAIYEAQANAILGFAQALADIGIDAPEVKIMANGTAKHIRGLPTIPAIPGTKEDES